MLRFILIALSICVCVLTCHSQTFTKPNVPDIIEFAGMKLQLTPAAKRKIEADVTMIFASGKYLQQKIDRANLYFPIIERMFHEEGMPEEFKYLALQESSLVSDAISSSNAVGFWQFKKETAIEVGIQVNSAVDERKHISYASRGAAKYLKKNNLLLDNWVYALLSYNVGPGGVKTHVKTKNVGAKSMVIDDDMHWYVIRFLAYKTAYEDLVGQANHPDISLIEYSGVKDKSLTEIARQSNVDPEMLKEYNKWCTQGRVPGDKEYIVILPTFHGTKATIENPQPHKTEPVAHTSSTPGAVVMPKVFPDISAYSDSSNIPVFVAINKVKAIKALKGDDINALVVKAGLTKNAFLYFNEMKSFETVHPGNFYYLQLKRKKALVAYHTVAKGETIHSIAQKYAITTGSIRKHNRMTKNEYVKENRVLWLRDTRPATTPIEYKTPLPVPVIAEQKKVIEKESVKPAIKETYAPANKSNAKNDTVFHIVQSGETVFGLSRKYQIDSDSIREWNQLNGYAIQLNQKLIIGFKSNEKHEITHIILPGETAYKISKQYNVSLEDIKNWNALPDYSLKPGQQLKLYIP